MTDFTDRLQRAAKFCGVGESQSEIADALNLSRQTINRWFKGGEPNAELTFAIARRLKVSPEWLKSGVGDMLPTIGDGLAPEERDLVKYYRSATPQVRQVISTMVRAVRKSAVAIACVIPPFLAPQQSEAAVLHNQNFGPVAGVIHIALRRLLQLLMFGTGQSVFGTEQSRFSYEKCHTFAALATP